MPGFVLALLILGILAGAFFATHSNIFGGSATSTPTPTARVVIATPQPGQ